MMSSAAAQLLAGVLVLVPASASASGRFPSPAEIRRAVVRGADDCRLERVDSVRLGRIRLWAIRRLVGVVGDVEPETRQLLSALKRVEVVTFGVEGGGCRLPADLDDAFEMPAWSRVVRETSEDGASLVYQHQDGAGEIDGLAVVELDGDELEVVTLEGRVEAFLAAVLAGEPPDLGLADD